LEVVPGARAVGVDRGEQDLAGAPLDRLASPLDRVPPARVPARVRHDLARPGVDRADDRLRAELVRERRQQLGAVDRHAVQGDLVGAGTQERPRVLELDHTAADGERDLELLGGALDELEQRPASLERRRDVEEDELVGAELGVAGRELDGVAHVAEVLEPHALDDATVRDVEAGDHAALDHRRTFSSSRAPAAPLRSGWNWTPARPSRCTAATTGPSWST